MISHFRSKFVSLTFLFEERFYISYVFFNLKAWFEFLQKITINKNTNKCINVLCALKSKRKQSRAITVWNERKCLYQQYLVFRFEFLQKITINKNTNKCIVCIEKQTQTIKGHHCVKWNFFTSSILCLDFIGNIKVKIALSLEWWGTDSISRKGNRFLSWTKFLPIEF